MKFLVIEGVDGSGKSTQIKLMMKYLEDKRIRYHYLHFPRTNAPFYGGLIARFLRGEFGTLNSVDPYLVALLYAGDRKDAAPTIKEWLNSGYLVLLDRYVYSNIAFQCAKVNSKEEKEQLSSWIFDLEYKYNGIPQPDLNLLLDVPFSFTESKLAGNRLGNERDYLQGLRDIHEDDLVFQKSVREMYLWQANVRKDFKIINCVDGNNCILQPETIFKHILDEMNIGH